MFLINKNPDALHFAVKVTAKYLGASYASVSEHVNNLSLREIESVILHEAMHVLYARQAKLLNKSFHDFGSRLEQASSPIGDGYKLHMFNPYVCQIKAGDTVEIINSNNPSFIGKKAKVQYINLKGAVGVLGLPGYEKEPYIFYKDRLKLVASEAAEINIKESIVYTKPTLNGANCSSCGVFNEYQTQEFTCYGCKNV